VLLTCLLEKAFGLNLILHKAKLTSQLGCDCIGSFRQINDFKHTAVACEANSEQTSSEGNLSILLSKFSTALKATQHNFLTFFCYFLNPYYYINKMATRWPEGNETWKKKDSKKEKFERAV